MSSEKIPHQISKNVIRNDEKSRNDVPNESFIQVVDHQPSLHRNQQSGNYDPTKEPKLVLEVTLLQTKYKCQKSNHHQHETNETVMGQKRSNCRIPFAQNRDLVRNEVPQRVVIDCHKNVPIEILCERDVLLLFLVPFNWVQFSENYHIEENDEQHAVKLTCSQDDQETHNHVNCGPCSLVKVLVELWPVFSQCVGRVGNLWALLLDLFRLIELCWSWFFVLHLPSATMRDWC